MSVLVHAILLVRERPSAWSLSRRMPIARSWKDCWREPNFPRTLTMLPRIASKWVNHIQKETSHDCRTWKSDGRDQGHTPSRRPRSIAVPASCL